jgi:hypothetical protein
VNVPKVGSIELSALTDPELHARLDDLERRRPGAPVPSIGVRPNRRPWTYRQIWELAALREERARRLVAGEAREGR